MKQGSAKTLLNGVGTGFSTTLNEDTMRRKHNFLMCCSFFPFVTCIALLAAVIPSILMGPTRQTAKSYDVINGTGVMNFAFGVKSEVTIANLSACASDVEGYWPEQGITVEYDLTDLVTEQAFRIAIFVSKDVGNDAQDWWFAATPQDVREPKGKVTFDDGCLGTSGPTMLVACAYTAEEIGRFPKRMGIGEHLARSKAFNDRCRALDSWCGPIFGFAKMDPKLCDLSTPAFPKLMEDIVYAPEDEWRQFTAFDNNTMTPAIIVCKLMFAFIIWMRLWAFVTQHIAFFVGRPASQPGTHDNDLMIIAPPPGHEGLERPKVTILSWAGVCGESPSVTVRLVLTNAMSFLVAQQHWRDDGKWGKDFCRMVSYQLIFAVNCVSSDWEDLDHQRKQRIVINIFNFCRCLVNQLRNEAPEGEKRWILRALSNAMFFSSEDLVIKNLVDSGVFELYYPAQAEQIKNLLKKAYKYGYNADAEAVWGELHTVLEAASIHALPMDKTPGASAPATLEDSGAERQPSEDGDQPFKDFIMRYRVAQNKQETGKNASINIVLDEYSHPDEGHHYFLAINDARHAFKWTFWNEGFRAYYMRPKPDDTSYVRFPGLRFVQFPQLFKEDTSSTNTGVSAMDNKDPFQVMGSAGGADHSDDMDRFNKQNTFYYGLGGMIRDHSGWFTSCGTGALWSCHDFPKSGEELYVQNDEQDRRPVFKKFRLMTGTLTEDFETTLVSFLQNGEHSRYLNLDCTRGVTKKDRDYQTAQVRWATGGMQCWEMKLNDFKILQFFILRLGIFAAMCVFVYTRTFTTNAEIETIPFSLGLLLAVVLGLFFANLGRFRRVLLYLVLEQDMTSPIWNTISPIIITVCVPVIIVVMDLNVFVAQEIWVWVALLVAFGMSFILRRMVTRYIKLTRHEYLNLTDASRETKIGLSIHNTPWREMNYFHDWVTFWPLYMSVFKAMYTRKFAWEMHFHKHCKNSTFRLLCLLGCFCVMVYVFIKHFFIVFSQNNEQLLQARDDRGNILSLQTRQATSLYILLLYIVVIWCKCIELVNPDLGARRTLHALGGLHRAAVFGVLFFPIITMVLDWFNSDNSGDQIDRGFFKEAIALITPALFCVYCARRLHKTTNKSGKPKPKGPAPPKSKEAPRGVPQDPHKPPNYHLVKPKVFQAASHHQLLPPPPIAQPVVVHHSYTDHNNGADEQVSSGSSGLDNFKSGPSARPQEPSKSLQRQLKGMPPGYPEDVMISDAELARRYGRRRSSVETINSNELLSSKLQADNACVGEASMYPAMDTPEPYDTSGHSNNPKYTSVPEHTSRFLGIPNVWAEFANPGPGGYRSTTPRLTRNPSNGYYTDRSPPNPRTASGVPSARYSTAESFAIRYSDAPHSPPTVLGRATSYPPLGTPVGRRERMAPMLRRAESDGGRRWWLEQQHKKMRELQRQERREAERHKSMMALGLGGSGGGALQRAQSAGVLDWHGRNKVHRTISSELVLVRSPDSPCGEPDRSVSPKLVFDA